MGLRIRKDSQVFFSVHSGADGSRQVTAKVDATGKGTKFVAMSVTTNGDPVSCPQCFQWVLLQVLNIDHEYIKSLPHR
jgi:hypothetical protein